MSYNVTITVRDHDTGDEDTVDLPEDDFVLFCGQGVECTSVNRFANGTTQLVIKPVNEPADGGA